MFDRSLIAAIAVVLALGATTAEIRAWDDSTYPDLKGQWVRAPGGGARYDWSRWSHHRQGTLLPRQEQPEPAAPRTHHDR